MFYFSSNINIIKMLPDLIFLDSFFFLGFADQTRSVAWSDNTRKNKIPVL